MLGRIVYLSRSPDQCEPCHDAILPCPRRLSGIGMSNGLALALGVLIVAGVSADLIANDGAALMFLLRRFLVFVEWVAFWR